MELSYEIAACPACDATVDDELASREEVVREMEDLWEFHIRRLRPGTPRRFLSDRLVFSQDPPIRIGRCGDCGTIYRNPVERGRDLLQLYAEEDLDTVVLRGLFAAQLQSYRRQARRLARMAGESGRALEVGSYVGAFQAAAAEIGWEVEGVDLNPSAVAFAREKGFRVHPGQIGDAPSAPRYDAIAIWNCFDQLPEPRLALGAARQRLRPGGVVAIRVPSGAFYARMRERLHTGSAPYARAVLAHNNLLGFPYRTGYTPEALEAMLEAQGYSDIEFVGDTLVPIADQWTRPWARWEERALKKLLAGALTGRAAPWLEVYARTPFG